MGIICIVSTAGDSIADDTELLTIVEIVRRSIEGLVDFQLSGLNGRLQQSASRSHLRGRSRGTVERFVKAFRWAVV